MMVILFETTPIFQLCLVRSHLKQIRTLTYLKKTIFFYSFLLLFLHLIRPLNYRYTGTFLWGISIRKISLECFFLYFKLAIYSIDNFCWTAKFHLHKPKPTDIQWETNFNNKKNLTQTHRHAQTDIHTHIHTQVIGSYTASILLSRR